MADPFIHFIPKLVHRRQDEVKVQVGSPSSVDFVRDPAVKNTHKADLLPSDLRSLTRLRVHSVQGADALSRQFPLIRMISRGIRLTIKGRAAVSHPWLLSISCQIREHLESLV